MNSNNNKNEELKKNILHLTINDSKYNWDKQYITGTEIREIAKIQDDESLFLAIERPWEDELISNETKVDLARPGIEHFFSKKQGTKKFVLIYINNVEIPIERGKYSVVEIKNVGNVPISHELEELIKGKLTPLEDNAIILIKGNEKFFSHVRDGVSS